ncbi:hypothetical protein QZH41_009834 [Actinostola sp. cb2023]|nr:hypothetical protein QZH41_009834 [Actinostola sp. cb2023]
MANELFAQTRSLVEVEKTKPRKSFSVVTYNTLADTFLLTTSGYQYCPETFKKRNGLDCHRHELLIKEMLIFFVYKKWDADYFKDTLLPTLSDLGYEGFQTIGSDGTDQGLASFFKKAAFDIVRQKTVANNDIVKEVCKEIGQEDLLEHLTMPNLCVDDGIATQKHASHSPSGNLIAIGNVHVLLDCQNFPAYRVLSTKTLTDDDCKALENFDYLKLSSDAMWPDPPKGKISSNEFKVLSNFKGFFKNYLTSVESTYKTVLGKEPDYTNCELVEVNWTLDYLWYSYDSLQPAAVLDMMPLDKLQHLIGLPNEFYPSDHLPLKAYYNFKPV